jgi:hypothetical protein
MDKGQLVTLGIAQDRQGAPGAVGDGPKGNVSTHRSLSGIARHLLLGRRVSSSPQHWQIVTSNPNPDEELFQWTASMSAL